MQAYEDDGNYQARLFIIARELELREGQLHTEQVSIFVGHRTVLTFQETPGDVWDPVRQRIRDGRLARCGRTTRASSPTR